MTNRQSNPHTVENDADAAAHETEVAQSNNPDDTGELATA